LAQKPFNEGSLLFKVSLESPDRKPIKGTYTFSFKGGEERKDLRLDNGFQDVILMNTQTGAVYSLQYQNGKKYAIELLMAEMKKRQEKYSGFELVGETELPDKVAGYKAYNAQVKYKDGAVMEVVYTKDWYPEQAIYFERFPGAKFMPLGFSYRDENNIVMRFEAAKLEAGPIDNAIFRIPTDYKMITNAEYKQMSR
jgi:hypothetical protein